MINGLQFNSNEALGIPASTFTDLIGHYQNIKDKILEGANFLITDMVNNGVQKQLMSP